jgi:hypothetical protein
MNFDFPTFLVAASALTGGIWLIDALFFASKRKQRAVAEAQGEAQVKVKEPVLVEYSRSFFSGDIRSAYPALLSGGAVSHSLRFHDADPAGG